jgi:hypothetical protein
MDFHHHRAFCEQRETKAVFIFYFHQKQQQLLLLSLIAHTRKTYKEKWTQQFLLSHYRRKER